MNTDRVKQINREIHLLLIELCSIADEEDSIIDSNIRTDYINRSGKTGVNAILNCDIKLIKKADL